MWVCKSRETILPLVFHIEFFAVVLEFTCTEVSAYYTARESLDLGGIHEITTISITVRNIFTFESNVLDKKLKANSKDRIREHYRIISR